MTKSFQVKSTTSCGLICPVKKKMGDYLRARDLRNDPRDGYTKNLYKDRVFRAQLASVDRSSNDYKS